MYSPLSEDLMFQLARERRADLLQARNRRAAGPGSWFGAFRTRTRRRPANRINRMTGHRIAHVAR